MFICLKPSYPAFPSQPDYQNGSQRQLVKKQQNIKILYFFLKKLKDKIPEQPNETPLAEHQPK